MSRTIILSHTLPEDFDLKTPADVVERRTFLHTFPALGGTSPSMPRSRVRSILLLNLLDR